MWISLEMVWSPVDFDFVSLPLRYVVDVERIDNIHACFALSLALNYVNLQLH